MTVIISCGFQRVETKKFRKKSISKGKKLIYSNHVGHVTEEILNEKRILRGLVLRETPGGQSGKNVINFYNPVIEVNIQINIVSVEKKLLQVEK